ncbi:MAG: hypothetical protein P8M29_07885 [Tateyamaria sp.]|nr:hypothetical protein [Tateyamaria sp.]MDG0983482.1 hypothetical protein [Tateyamaria sp.]MDG1420595.1 hypothetical protein [Tateyamaria sp.]MDG2378795.1 hypothetical protein [Tateyamaria sp.]
MCNDQDEPKTVIKALFLHALFVGLSAIIEMVSIGILQGSSSPRLGPWNSEGEC